MALEADMGANEARISAVVQMAMVVLEVVALGAGMVVLEVVQAVVPVVASAVEMCTGAIWVELD